MSYSACGVIFLGGLTSFSLALASFHGFTPFSARVDLIVGHFWLCWHGRDLPPILYRFLDDGEVVSRGYYEDEPRQRSAAKLLTKDEARWIAVNIAKFRASCRNANARRISEAPQSRAQYC
jgi:hypothetical protein